MENNFELLEFDDEMPFEEWKDMYEDLLDWDFWEDLSDREILYVGGVYDHQGSDTAVSLLKLTFTTPDKDTVIPEDLGIFTTPEAALKAAGIGHYHRVAEYIFDYFTGDDELDETSDEEPPNTPAV